MRLPHKEELFGENALFAIKKDWRKRVKAIIGEENRGGYSYWTDTSFSSDSIHICVVNINGGGSYNNAGNILWFAPCFERK